MLQSKVVSCVFQVLLLFHQKVNWNLLEKQLANGNAMKKILSLLTTLLLLTSCSQEELGTPFYAGQEVSISAAFSNSHPANNGKQRISGKDSGSKINLSWDEGDEILVTVGDKSAVFTLSSGAGTNNAIFSGTMPADGSNFHVSYPIDYTDEVLTNQTYTADGFGKGLMKMSTKSAGTLDEGFTLSADNALLGLKLQGDANVSKIVLTNNDNQKTYTLDCSTQTVNTTEGTLFYIVVPAGTWANGLKVEVYNGNGIVIEERIKTSAAEFVAGQALMMPEVEVHDILTFEVNGVKFNMVYVEGGTFMMGAADDDTMADADEKPQHQVTVSDFMIGQTEVTQTLWKAVMGTTPSVHIGDNLPVEQVTWDDCQQFIQSINQLTGRHFRLPTEAEWEYAARGGQKSHGYLYAGSNNINEVAWYVGNSDGKTHDVGTKQPNELGIFDMSGNVYEKCQDWYSPYIVESQINPQGPTEPLTWRVVRGGCSNRQSSGISSENVCRITNRGYARPDSRVSITGLRLVLDMHNYVDLGLSVLWATCNVGANNAEDYGDLFAWGETEPKEVYGWNTYNWCDGTGTNMTKYNSTDGLTTLLPEDDAAHVHWGGQWRMPSDVEMSELISDCTWELITKNGVKGYQITSKVEGYLDQSIFWPCAGYLNHDLNNIVSASARYWTNKCNGSNACNLYEFETIMYNTRRCGCSIRPVLPKN